jgi:hypothetical protein
MKLFAITATLLVVASVAHAAPITTLWNTGVDATGTPLPNNALDTHYSLFSGPIVGAPRAANDSNGYPLPPWIGNDSISAWIGPVSDSQLNGFAGVYDYRTTFSLTGFSAASAVITGQWATDNEGFILINGVSTGHTSSSQYSAFTAFTITSGFVAGLNTIDFFVVNVRHSPTGLRVEQTGTANPNAVPEPAALALFGVGAAMLGLARRRRG